MTPQRPLLTDDGDGKAARRLPDDGSDLSRAHARLHPKEGAQMHCSECGAPVDARGQYQDDERETERAEQLEREARELMARDKTLDLGSAMRLVNRRREEAAQRAAEEIRSGVTPAQRERADYLERSARRHMAESGCDFGEGLRRALSESRRIARHYERG